MKPSSHRQFHAEFWRIAGPAVACVAVLVGMVVLVPTVAAVTHAYAKMDARRTGTPLSILDMSPAERDAIMTRHHVKLLTDLQTQFMVMDACARDAQRAEDDHPSPANAQTLRVHRRCLDYLVANYNGIAAKTPVPLLNHAHLPCVLREAPPPQ